MPSVSSRVAIRDSGPRRESAVEVVNSFMFEASGRCLLGAPGADRDASFAVDDEQAAGAAPAVNQARPHGRAELSAAGRLRRR